MATRLLRLLVGQDSPIKEFHISDHATKQSHTILEIRVEMQEVSLKVIEEIRDMYHPYAEPVFEAMEDAAIGVAIRQAKEL
jgi:hypothetical protein